MATFYIQLENKLLQISGELTAENISKALGYVPVSPNVTNELSQRVDNITFDSLKDNPFLQDGSGELNIVDEAGNIIAKIDAEGIHSVDFIAGTHKLTDKIDSSALNGYAKESWVTAEITKAATEGKVDLTGYATEEWVENKNYLTEHQDISHLATKQEVSNIDFYNINNNPIVNNGDGKLLFVDENGYIGLQLEEDGLYVKDVIADGHTLSQKADKSDIPSLDGYATESYVNTNLQNYATKDEVSDLVDMSVVTELQGKVNTLIDADTDKSVRDIAVDVLTETLVSETATEAYDTLAEMSAWIKSHPEDAAAMNTAIQKNATDIQSNATAISNLDVAYKAADAKVLTDAQEYTDNINFFTIKDNPIVDGEAGSITFVDETGYIGLKVTEDGIVVKDVVTPEHTLSNKADKSFVEDNYYDKLTADKKIAEAVTGGQISLDGFATEQWVNEQGFLTEHQDITGKQDAISDLTNIRNGAAKGATAVQPSSLAKVATSGSYNDLSNKPTIPSAVTESTVSGWGFTKNTGTITGVSANGTSVATSGVANIPAASTSAYGVTKLSSATNSSSTTLAATASAVKAAYDLANSYKGTVTSVKVDNVSKSQSSGVVDLGYVNKQLSTSTSSSMTLSPNIYYRNTSTSLSTLTITLGSASNNNIINEYFVEFTTSNSGTAVSLPSGIKWMNGVTPTFEASTTYQISIVNNLGTWVKFK